MKKTLAVSWCEPRRGKHDPHYETFSKESLEDWHRRHGLLGGEGS